MVVPNDRTNSNSNNNNNNNKNSRKNKNSNDIGNLDDLQADTADAFNSASSSSSSLEFNHRIQYRIVSSHLYPFTINQQTGLITLKEKLDRELQAQYVVDVEISEAVPSDSDAGDVTAGGDGDEPHQKITSQHTLMSRTPVIINIADIDDNMPHALSQIIRCQVFNNLPSEIPICHVIAYDSDTTSSNDSPLTHCHGKKYSLTYEITEGNEKSYFKIDTSTGAIYLNEANDLLIPPRTYDLTVSALTIVTIE